MQGSWTPIVHFRKVNSKRTGKGPGDVAFATDTVANGEADSAIIPNTLSRPKIRSLYDFPSYTPITVLSHILKTCILRERVHLLINQEPKYLDPCVPCLIHSLKKRVVTKQNTFP